jgi:hypothetical protein
LSATVGERHDGDDARLQAFGRDLDIASVKKGIAHQVMSMKARGNGIETVVDDGSHRTNCRAGRSTFLRSVIRCRRAQVQPLFAGNEDAVIGGRHRPLKASDGSERLSIAASAKEETSGNLANFVIASLRPQPEHASCTVQAMCRVSWQSSSHA